jgi:hypothetical protein
MTEPEEPTKPAKPRKKREPQKKTGGKRGRGQGALRKDGKPRESSTGTAKPVVDDSGWRVKAQRKSRIKFDDKAKQRYLEALRQTGRRWQAEDAAGVARTTVDDHKENDPEFAAACEEAAEEFVARGLAKIERDAVEGHIEKRYDPMTGTLVSEVPRFETQLRVKFLERYEREYHPKHQIEHSGAISGVITIPGVAALTEWEEAIRKHDRDNAKSQDPDAAEIHVGDTSECTPAQG